MQTNKAKKSNVKQLILRYCLIVLIALVFGLGIYQWNATSLTNDQLPMPLGFGMAVVVSGSMEPELSVNDVVVVCPQDSYEVEVSLKFPQKLPKAISADPQCNRCQEIGLFPGGFW